MLAGRIRPQAIGTGRLNRKLTTILCADLVGYSRLMEENEELTHIRVLQLSTDVLQPILVEYEGRLIKTTGDGILAHFDSVIQATLCAISIQQEVRRRNETLETNERLTYRIGINIGDVFVETNDIYGDGVNVAVRLEALASPGGIVVSRAVRDSMINHQQLCFVDLGEVRVKNIARPIHAFSVETATPADACKNKTEGRKLPRLGVTSYLSIAASIGLGLGVLGPEQSRNYVSGLAVRLPALLNGGTLRDSMSGISILVVPFSNLSGDPQQDYFVDGITESLITDLSRALPGAFITSRGTAFRLKAESADAERIRRELKVRYLLEGSVTAEKEIRVNARLVDAATGRELWAERFDSRRDEVLDVQDQIVARLSRAIGLNLVDIEARLARVRANDPTAVDLVMRAQSIANRPASPDNMIAARDLFQQALNIDAANPDALAGIGTTYVFEVLNSYYHQGREKRLSDAGALIERALDIDPNHLVALKAHAAILRANGRFEDAIAASQAVIARNPGEPWAYKEIGLSELYLGKFKDSLVWFGRADRIGPRDPSRWIWLGAMGRVHFFLGHDEEAIRLLRLSANANPRDARAYAMLAAIFALLEQREQAAWALANAVRIQPDISISRLFDDWSVPLEVTDTLYRAQHSRFRVGLERAGLRN